MNERILLLAADFGSGHLQAARSIAEACVDRNEHCTAEAINIDNSLLQLASSGYLTLLQHAPSAYRSLYHARMGSGIKQGIRIALAPAVGRELRRARPTAVVATHPFPGSVAAYLRRTGRLQAPLAMVVTDFYPHPLWVHEGVDRYFVASDEAALTLQTFGVAPERIRTSGIPVRRDFATSNRSLHPRNARHILVMGGGLGLGPIVSAVRSLTTLGQADLQVTVVCGNNAELQQTLTDAVGHDRRVQILGFTDRVAALMAHSDLLVTKPGGITGSEALASGLPMLLLRPLPGQEEENAAYLASTRAARVVDERYLGETAAHLLYQAPEQLVMMQGAARRAGRPQSAASIANEIFMLSSANRHTHATA